MGRDSRRSRTAIAVLLVLAFSLITVDYKTTDSAGGVRGFLHAVVGGVESGLSAVGRPVGRTVSSLAHPNRYQDRADALAAENAELRRQVGDDAEVRQLAGELSALRLLADRGQYTIMPARVVAVGDVTGTDWTMTISVGSDDGVAVDKLVLSNDGLVGTVESVTSHTSVVRLICDPASHIGARLEGTRLLGAVAGGQGPAALTFTLYDASHQVQKGDRLVTFGSTDYAAGAPIGEVTEVVDVGGLSRTAEVKPFVTFATLDLVGVVMANPPADPGDRVLEPRPAPPAEAVAPPSGTSASPAPGTAVAPAPDAATPDAATPDAATPDAAAPGAAGPGQGAALGASAGAAQ